MIADGDTFTLFSGCVLQTRIPQLERVGREILQRIGIDIVDCDFSCCPSNAVRDVDENTWLSIASRNLALAEAQNLDILCLCNECSYTLLDSSRKLRDADLKSRINTSLEKVGQHYSGKNQIFHFMMLLDQRSAAIQPLVINPLQGLRVASHSGCHLLRPSRIMGYDNAENPKKFDALIKLMGSTPVDYQLKTLCCGSTQFTRERKIALDLMRDKLHELYAKKTDILTVCCPSCFLHYDTNQLLNKEKNDVDYTIPVVHILQLLGLAIGMTTKQVFLEDNKSMTSSMLEKLTELTTHED